MRLALCPQCGQTIDLDAISELPKELPSTTVIGCGMNVKDFSPCDGCPEEDNPSGCKALRDLNGFTKTTVADKTDDD